MIPMRHCITGWEYIEQSRREILNDRGIPLPGLKRWNSSAMYDFFEITKLTALRRWDLFYDFETDSYRETLNPKESAIASRSDLTHEERRAQIYLLRGDSYLQRPSFKQVTVERQSGFDEPQSTVKPFAVTMSSSHNRSPTITDEDKILAKYMGIALD
jgi:hypothetical protein